MKEKNNWVYSPVLAQVVRIEQVFRKNFYYSIDGKFPHILCDKTDAPKELGIEIK